jgi:hypothetical protein
MSYQGSVFFQFEKRLIVNEGNYILSIKLPTKIRHYEYQGFGDDGYQYMAEEKVGNISKKEKENISHYIFLVTETLQNIFFQLKIYMEDGKICQYHEFIDIGEMYKEMKPSIPPICNIKMEVKDKIEEKAEDEVEEEDEDEDEEDDEIR